MRFIQLVHFEPSKLDDLPLEQKQEIDRQALAKNAELAASGHLVHTEAVQGGDSAVLVRVRHGKVSVTDGPYIETKEQMAGFVLIEARDMAEAVAIAGEDPLATIGTIEVRPIFEIPTPP